MSATLFLRHAQIAFVLVGACGSSQAPTAAPADPAPVVQEGVQEGGQEVGQEGVQQVAAEDPSAQRVCASVISESAYERAVDGAHRGCNNDAECVSLRLDCSNLRCGAVHQSHAPSYAEAIQCDAYSGPVGNYDCMPEFNAEEPVCINGCCTSERQIGRASAEEACGAIAEVYARDGCTLFGPSFSVEQCLTDVRGIRAESGESGERQLQVGLDCARSIGSCGQLQFCVSQFRE